MAKLNLGCGSIKLPGYINIDIDPDNSPDKIMDFEKRWTLKDNSADEVHCFFTLEFIRDIDHFMKELYRVCKPNAIINIRVVHPKSTGATCPLHLRRFDIKTFKWFDLSNGDWKRSVHPPYNFKVIKAKTIRGKIRFWKPYSMHFTLKAIK